jgi:hypothetical protein
MPGFKLIGALGRVEMPHERDRRQEAWVPAVEFGAVPGMSGSLISSVAAGENAQAKGGAKGMFAPAPIPGTLTANGTLSVPFTWSHSATTKSCSARCTLKNTVSMTSLLNPFGHPPVITFALDHVSCELHTWRRVPLASACRPRRSTRRSRPGCWRLAPPPPRRREGLRRTRAPPADRRGPSPRRPPAPAALPPGP